MIIRENIWQIVVINVSNGERADDKLTFTGKRKLVKSEHFTESYLRLNRWKEEFFFPDESSF